MGGFGRREVADGQRLTNHSVLQQLQIDLHNECNASGAPNSMRSSGHHWFKRVVGAIVRSRPRPRGPAR